MHRWLIIPKLDFLIAKKKKWKTSKHILILYVWVYMLNSYVYMSILTIFIRYFWSHRMWRIIEKCNVPWFRVLIFRLAIIHENRVLGATQIYRSRSSPSNWFFTFSTKTKHLFAFACLRIDQKPCVFLFAWVQDAVAGSTRRASHQLWYGIRQFLEATHVTPFVEASIAWIWQIMWYRIFGCIWHFDSWFWKFSKLHRTNYFPYFILVRLMLIW